MLPKLPDPKVAEEVARMAAERALQEETEHSKAVARILKERLDADARAKVEREYWERKS